MRTPEGMAKETLRLVIEDCIRQGMHHYNISTGTFPQTIAVLLGRLEHRSGIQVPEVTVTVV